MSGGTEAPAKGHEHCLHGEDIIVMQERQAQAEKDAERRHEENVAHSERIANSIEKMTDKLGDFMKTTGENSVRIYNIEGRQDKADLAMIEEKKRVDTMFTETFNRLRGVEATPGKIAIWVMALLFTICATAYIAHTVGKTQGEEISEHRELFKQLKAEEAKEKAHGGSGQ